MELKIEIKKEYDDIMNKLRFQLEESNKLRNKDSIDKKRKQMQKDMRSRQKKTAAKTKQEKKQTNVDSQSN